MTPVGPPSSAAMAHRRLCPRTQAYTNDQAFALDCLRIGKMLIEWVIFAIEMTFSSKFTFGQDQNKCILNN